MAFLSTKTFGHSLGFSCVFRQWRANHSHCQYLHGYAIGIKLVFDCNELDERNWVMDFGAMKEFKRWAKYMFDHTVLIAKDDPALHEFIALEEKKLCQLRVVDAVGCEKFAQLCFKKMEELLASHPETLGSRPINKTVGIKSVEVREHEANSAIYERS